MLDNGAEQFIIWMHEKKQSLIRQSYFGMGIKHEYWLRSRAGGSGMFFVDGFCRKLPDAGLLTQDLRNNVSLTDRGNAFAKWLIENGHKAIFFESEVGGWCARPDDISGWLTCQFRESPEVSNADLKSEEDAS